MPEGDTVRELFAQFVSLRQNAHSRDEAWRAIESAASLLSAHEREQLITMLRIWESNEGQAYKSVEDPFETQNKPPAKLVEKRNVIRRIQPVDQAPLPSNSTECPTCHKPNPPGSLYCYSCGAILRTIAPPNATRPLGPSGVDNAYFGENWALYLKVQGTTETVRVQPRQVEMILGRKSPDSVMVPDVDLSVYSAGDKGVSRLHASIRRQENTLVLTDLGSVNHTFINGQRVHAHEVRVLHDGDEVRLGRLVLYAYFRES
jgi:hypothetical protein